MTTTTTQTNQTTDRLGNAPTMSDLSDTAARLGLIEIGDSRWAREEHELDRLLHALVDLAEEPESTTWRQIADHPDTTLVVKLRAVGTIMCRLRSSPPVARCAEPAGRVRVRAA